MLSGVAVETRKSWITMTSYIETVHIPSRKQNVLTPPLVHENQQKPELVDTPNKTTTPTTPTRAVQEKQIREGTSTVNYGSD